MNELVEYVEAAELSLTASQYLLMLAAVDARGKK